MKTPKLLVTVAIFLLFPVPSLFAETSVSDQQEVWQKVQDYARCIQNRSHIISIDSERAVDRVAADCSDTRRALQNVAPNKNFADIVDAKMKKQVKEKNS